MCPKDHIALGLCIAKAMNADAKQKLMFILGNVAPDMNPFSYITFCGLGWTKGHAYITKKEYIDNVIATDDEKNISCWYNWGKMTHYLADSFTKPHNVQFFCPFKEHKAYEDELHQHFMENMDMKNAKAYMHNCNGSDMADDENWLYSQHRQYLHEASSVDTDYSYILKVAMTVCGTKKMSSKAKKLTSKSYNKSGIRHFREAFLKKNAFLTFLFL